MPDLSFSCTCGKLTGRLLGASPGTGTRAECFCADCHAAERYAGQPDVSPIPLWQSTPDRVRIDSGHEYLSAFSFSPRGVLRWRAACCGATLANTPRNPKMAFVGFRADRIHDTGPLGRTIAQAFVPQQDGRGKHKMSIATTMRIITRLLAARISGRWRDTPFFTPDGTPVQSPTLVPKETRAKLR